MDLEPSMRWKPHYTTQWEAFPNLNQPMNFSEEAESKPDHIHPTAKKLLLMDTLVNYPG